MSLVGNTAFALWYTVYPAISFWAGLRSWHFSAKNFLNPIHVFLFVGFFSITFSNQCRLKMIRLCDTPSGWLVPPCTTSFRNQRTECINWCTRSICQSESTSKLDRSFTGCWLWGPWSQFYCIDQSGAQVYWRIWLLGSRCTCYSTPWGTCI